MALLRNLRSHLALVLLLIALTTMLSGCIAPISREWSPRRAPLQTQWYDEVSATNALPEYPRPQMARATWQNLNGVWEFAPARANAQAPVGKTLRQRILVPFPIESALSGIMDHHEHMWYRRTFSVPQDWAGQRVLLHFGAVDWHAIVHVNGAQVGEHKGGYDAFTFDITDHLVEGENELIVGVFDPTDGGTQPVGKQRLEPGGIWYTSVSGIWQTVWLEAVPALHIERLVLTPDLENETINVTALISNGASATVEAVVSAAGAEVARMQGESGAPLAIPIPDPNLWSPDDPFLYDLTVRLVDGDAVLDSVDSYFGMRSVRLERIGFSTRILLNDEFVFQMGLLDQGFWPEGIYTAPTDAALRYDIEKAKELGYNLLRKHVKVEPQRWYYWADKLGILVWQDMPNMPEYKEVDDAAAAQFRLELQEMVTELSNVTSIIMWVPFNEGWGQHDTIGTVAMLKQMDPSRLVNNASGWTDMSVGDVTDVHAYVGPAMPTPSSGRASVLGEYGGLGLQIDGHQWNPRDSYNYEMQSSMEQLTARYLDLLTQLQPMLRGGLSAAIYTQLTDVEIEVNGVLTYERALEKMDMSQIIPAHQALIEMSAEIQ